MGKWLVMTLGFYSDAATGIFFVLNLEEEGWNLTRKDTSSVQQCCAGEEWGEGQKEMGA